MAAETTPRCCWFQQFTSMLDRGAAIPVEAGVNACEGRHGTALLACIAADAGLRARRGRCTGRVYRYPPTRLTRIEGDPVAIAAQTSTQRKCVVKDMLGRTWVRFGVLLLHTMTQKSQTPIMVTRYRRIDMHCGKLSHSATTNKA